MGDNTRHCGTRFAVQSLHRAGRVLSASVEATMYYRQQVKVPVLKAVCLARMIVEHPCRQCKATEKLQIVKAFVADMLTCDSHRIRWKGAHSIQDVGRRVRVVTLHNK